MEASKLEAFGNLRVQEHQDVGEILRKMRVHQLHYFWRYAFGHLLASPPQRSGGLLRPESPATGQLGCDERNCSSKVFDAFMMRTVPQVSLLSSALLPLAVVFVSHKGWKHTLNTHRIPPACRCSQQPDQSPPGQFSFRTCLQSQVRCLQSQVRHKHATSQRRVGGWVVLQRYSKRCAGVDLHVCFQLLSPPSAVEGS